METLQLLKTQVIPIQRVAHTAFHSQLRIMMEIQEAHQRVYRLVMAIRFRPVKSHYQPRDIKYRAAGGLICPGHRMTYPQMWMFIETAVWWLQLKIMAPTQMPPISGAADHLHIKFVRPGRTPVRMR